MKKALSICLCLLAACTGLQAQQTLSSFPVSIDKAEYDDREAVFVKNETGESGVFVSDNSVVHFVKLDEAGNAASDLKQNMPLNYSSLKRAGVGTLEGNYYCYFLQGNKKLSAWQADVQSGKLSYLPFPLPNEKDALVGVAAGPGYLYMITASADAKGEWNVYKYTKPSEPQLTKVKTEEADLFKTLGISSSKAAEQLAILPLDAPAHFTQTSFAAKIYHSPEALWLTFDAPEGETKIWNLTEQTPKMISFKSETPLEKKSVFKSVIYQNKLYQLTVSSNGLQVKSTGIDGSAATGNSPQSPDFFVESSYSARIGYNRERKAAVSAEMIKSFQRADAAGLGLMEGSNGKMLLVAGLSNKNNLTDPTLENSDTEQKGGLSVNMIMERNYADLHLPSYAPDQYALLRFKNEIWVYTYWVLDANSGQTVRAMPEDVVALDEALDLYYRDPLNNAAPAAFKLDKTFVFGFYAAKNQEYNLYKITGKQAGSNMNRR